MSGITGIEKGHFRDGIATADLPSIHVREDATNATYVVSLGKYILGPVRKRGLSRRGVTFSITPGHALSIRWRPLSGRDYYYGFLDRMSFSSSCPRDRDLCVKELKQRLRTFAIMVSCLLLLMMVMWIYIPNPERMVPLGLFWLVCIGAYAIAASIATRNAAVAIRIAWWSPIVAAVLIAVFMRSGIVIVWGCLVVQYVHALRPMADALGIEPWDIFGLTKRTAQRWKKGILIDLSADGWLACKGCDNYLSEKLYPEDVMCPACWSKERWPRAVAYNLDRQ
ncbi:MAG: hypothetical protein SGI88_06960 [Candidatus Hydrogenedentes bacterium]|nr:hypothetical protein [Candidatus Hydrogenedentota bacterium]